VEKHIWKAFRPWYLSTLIRSSRKKNAPSSVNLLFYKEKVLAINLYLFIYLNSLQMNNLLNFFIFFFYLLQLFYHLYPNWNIPKESHFDMTTMSHQVTKTDYSNAREGTTYYRLPKGTSKNPKMVNSSDQKEQVCSVRQFLSMASTANHS